LAERSTRRIRRPRWRAIDLEHFHWGKHLIAA
jgi:hypothetical protein